MKDWWYNLDSFFKFFTVVMMIIVAAVVAIFIIYGGNDESVRASDNARSIVQPPVNSPAEEVPAKNEVPTQDNYPQGSGGASMNMGDKKGS